mgnify:CR=1 FL=1
MQTIKNLFPKIYDFENLLEAYKAAIKSKRYRPDVMEYADKLEELKTICWFCHKKATMNLHYIDGKPVYEGDQVQIGGNEAYYPVCRKHYFHPKTVNEEQ